MRLIGRLTRDPEPVRTFGNDNRTCKFGFAVNNRKKNHSTGQWEDEPMFVDVEVYSRGEQKLVEFVSNYCKRGSLILVAGRLHLDTWEAKDGGGKRSKHKIVADNIQLLDQKPKDGERTENGELPNRAPAPVGPQPHNYSGDESVPF